MVNEFSNTAASRRSITIQENGEMRAIADRLFSAVEQPCCGFQAFGMMPPCVLNVDHDGDREDGISGHYGRTEGSELVAVQVSKQIAYVSGSYLAGLRSCADCDTYAEPAAMVAKTDGRLVCPACAKRSERANQRRAQINLFGQQSLI